MFCKNTKLIVLGPRPIVLNQKAEKHPKPKTLNQTSYTKVQSPMNTLSQMSCKNTKPIVLSQKVEEHPKSKTLNQTSYTKAQSPMNTLSQISCENTKPNVVKPTLKSP